MGRRLFSEDAIPAFEDAPSVILVSGSVDFFVEEAAAAVASRLAGPGDEVLRFGDDAPADAISDALLNRSLFSARRVVQLDATGLLGTETPGMLLTSALEAWERGGAAGRRDAFRTLRALLKALRAEHSGEPLELAEKIAAKCRKREAAATIAEILSDLPEERAAGSAAEALRVLLGHGNDGVVAVLSAISPASGGELMEEIAQKGLVLEHRVDEKSTPEALKRLAGARAREREVTMDPDAVARLIQQTDADPALFSAELSRLLGWAGQGGRIASGDIRATVPDESSENVYLFLDALGRRDAAETLGRLERLFSGRDVRMGEREMDTEDYWPVRFFGIVTSELRRMLLVRAALDASGVPWDARMSSREFESRVLPRLKEQDPALAGKPAFEGSPYLWYNVAKRSAPYRTGELARALARAAAVDAMLKSSSPPLPALTAFVGRLVGAR